MTAKNTVTADLILIEKFIELFDNTPGINQSKIAKEVGRSPAWFTYLLNGRIKSLNSDTRKRIKKILILGLGESS